MVDQTICTKHGIKIFLLNNDSKSQILVSEISVYQRIYITANVVTRTVHLEYTRFASVGNGTMVIRIPNGYYPIDQKVIHALVISGDDTVQIGSLVIEPNGDVKMQAVDANTNIRGSFVCEWEY